MICAPTGCWSVRAVFLGRGARRRLVRKGVTPGSGAPAGAGGVGVPMSSLMSAPVGQREGARRRDMEAI
jgi:hypothetical protein